MDIQNETIEYIQSMIPYKHEMDLPPDMEIAHNGGVWWSNIIEKNRDVIDNMPPEMVFEQTSDFLGTYHPMSSPGIVTLYPKRIGSFFWHVILRLSMRHVFIRTSDIKNMCGTLVFKVYCHEHFHHFCDVMRHISGCKFDRMREEALAVGWSYKKLMDRWRDKRTDVGKLSERLFCCFIDEIFAYRAPGYKDWVNYKSEFDLRQGIMDYLVQPGKARLLGNAGVEVSKLLFAVQESLGRAGVQEICRY